MENHDDGTESLETHNRYPGFAARLRRGLTEKGISALELSRTLEVSRTMVGKYIDGASFPSRDRLLAICGMLEIPMDELVVDPTAIEYMKTPGAGMPRGTARRVETTGDGVRRVGFSAFRNGKAEEFRSKRPTEPRELTIEEMVAREVRQRIDRAVREVVQEMTPAIPDEVRRRLAS